MECGRKAAAFRPSFPPSCRHKPQPCHLRKRDVKRAIHLEIQLSKFVD